MKNKLLIVGAGGHGRVVADAAEQAGHWSEIAFLDERFPELTTVGAWKVVGKFSDAKELSKMYSDATVGIGDNQIRLSLLKQLVGTFKLPVIAHPTSSISKYAKIGEGTVLFAQTAVNIGAVIGMGAIVNTSVSVDHDCQIGEGVHLSPGAHVAGNVKIGDLSWIGIGAALKHGITIGKKVMIGAGAAVVNDIEDGATAVGVPAKIRISAR